MLILSTLLLACSFVYFKPIPRIAYYPYYNDAQYYEGRIGEGLGKYDTSKLRWFDGQYYNYDVVWRSPPFKWYNGVAIAGAIAYLLAAASWLRGWGRGASAVSVDEMP